ncbi:MAG: CvpA family protein [Bacillota bacterium]|nr:CvpA family protein [Bacillota bacterium]
MNYIDLFIGGTLVIAIVKGYRRGVLNTIARIASYVIGLGVAIYHYGSFANWLDERIGLAERIGAFIYGLLPLPTTVMTAAVDGLGIEELTDILAELPLPGFYQQQMLSYIDNYQVMLAGSIISIGETIAMILANTVVEIVCFAMILLGVMIITRKLVSLVSWGAYKTPFGGLNSAIGAALGLLIGIISTVIFMGLLVPIVALGQVAQIEPLVTVGQQVNTSLLLPFFLGLFALFQASAGGIVPFASGLFKM